MQRLSISETRANLKAVLDRVVADKSRIAITRPRGEGVVMVSESEWASIEETLYLLQSPANAKRLLDSVAEFDTGEGEGPVRPPWVPGLL
jgi:antitoxin YefM